MVVLAALTMPRATPALLVFAGCLAVIAMLATRPWRFADVGRDPVAIALLALAAYMFINSAWALSQGAALEKSAIFLTLAVAAVALNTGVSATDEPGLRRTILFSIAAFLLGLTYILLETLSDQAIWKYAYNNIAFLKVHSDKHVVREGEKIVRAASYIFNRNAACAVLLLFPILQMTGALEEGYRLPAKAILICATLAAVFLSQSGTAGVALLVSLLVWLAARLSLKTVRWAAISVWVIGIGLAVPLGALPHKLGWTELNWSSDRSVPARFYIWSYTAEKAQENLLTGIGVRGTRSLVTPAPASLGEDYANRMRPRPGRHAHNAFLQIWLELGAIGAVLIMVLGLAVLRAIGRLGEKAAAIGYAQFASACAVAAFGFGLWQTWLLAGIFLSAVVFTMSLKMLQRG